MKGERQVQRLACWPPPSWVSRSAQGENSSHVLASKGSHSVTPMLFPGSQHWEAKPEFPRLLPF